ncbi:hypothetical protein evm_014165 [Chilo suppressalis]|nr:hypothetical protein evm_014165 [Chilo suppressalis]
MNLNSGLRSLSKSCNVLGTTLSIASSSATSIRRCSPYRLHSKIMCCRSSFSWQWGHFGSSVIFSLCSNARL